MNVSDWQKAENQKERKNLEQQGFEFEITADGYTVRFKGEWVGGASVKLPREKHLHWKHRDANLRDNLESALRAAKRSKFLTPSV